MSTTNQNPLKENLSLKPDLPQPQLSQGKIVRLEEEEEVRNRKWGEEEHILYILFLENNREKTKSKLIRRSNSFYKEMAAFIGSKTAVQCRSHHQKFEEKYKYPHRIIKEEKEKVCSQLYAHQSSKISMNNLPRHEQKEPFAGGPKTQLQSRVTLKEISCQTDLEGVQHTLMMTQPSEVTVNNNVPYMVSQGYLLDQSLDSWRMYNMRMPWGHSFYSL